MIKRIFLILMLVCSLSYADTVKTYKTYSAGSVVDYPDLNGNRDYILQEVNGDLDNNNAATSRGYRFIEVVTGLPAAGQQGRVIFNKVDNTLNFDTGSTWVTSPGLQLNNTFTGSNTFNGLNTFSNIDINGGTIFIPGITSTGQMYVSNSSLDISAQDQQGRAGEFLVSRGSGQPPTWSAASETQTFTSSGTFVVPSGRKQVWATVVGGGAGGGAGTGGFGAGGGGGGGSAFMAYCDTSTITSVAVTVGLGGAGGAPVGNNGSDGGASSFGGFVTANGGTASTNGGGGSGGGSGGTATITSLGTPGSGATGTAGGAGGMYVGNRAYGGTTKTGGNGGAGAGASNTGGGGGASLLASGGNSASAGNFPGGGGGGGLSGATGGAGANGVVYVFY